MYLLTITEESGTGGFLNQWIYITFGAGPGLRLLFGGNRAS
jgi:hypothetical protein